MYISKNWLAQFVQFPKGVTPEMVADRLKMSTVEVEDITHLGAHLTGIVVGKIISVDKHPDADKLKVCSVNVGKEKLQIVCGGSNVEKNMLVAVATLGSFVRWHGAGEPIEMKEATIRGVASSGMISASDEIGLGELFPKKEEREILDLTHIVPKAKPGTLLAEALHLNDVIFEIDNKSLSNRPDLWGHEGIAREVAALFGAPFVPFVPTKIKGGKGVTLSIDVKEKTTCPRYMGVALSGVVVQSSPLWLRQRLESVGVNPINTIVDVANLVMLELGQPMHAFDAETISQNAKIRTNKSIIVRKAKEGESFTALGDKPMMLTSDDLVIADEDRVLALAGVKGGADSGVTSATTSIIFESANFEPVSIRQSATRHGLRTDASARYEKSLDPVLCERALARAVSLVLELCPTATVVSPVVDVAHFHVASGPLQIDHSFIEKRLGISITKKEVVNILTRLGFGIREKKEGYAVTIPSWRATKDISIPEDVVEEVARLYGYDRIPATLPVFPIVPPAQDSLRVLMRSVRDTLSLACQMTEVYNYSFVSGETLRRLGLSESTHIELANPLAKDRPFVRQSLLPNLLENIESNLHRFDRVALFEIGRVYEKDEPGDRQDAKGDILLPRQDTHLTLVVSEKGDETPFHTVSSAVRVLCEELGFPLSFVVDESHAVSYLHPGRRASLVLQGEVVGYIGELLPQVQQRFGAASRVGILDLNLSRLSAIGGTSTTYTAIPQYPSVDRDIAFVVDTTVTHADLSLSISSFHPLIVSVELFDVYRGGSLPGGKKSVAYHITYRSGEKTLETKEVDAVHTSLVTMLKDEFGAEVR